MLNLNLPPILHNLLIIRRIRARPAMIHNCKSKEQLLRNNKRTFWSLQLPQIPKSRVASPMIAIQTLITSSMNIKVLIFRLKRIKRVLRKLETILHLYLMLLST